eukprot:TRINITY_DN10235_c0_g1_i1.p1 TRINITY_DN10235_c0_g1~~TRINITY_DN10235_c0_g1_i1.p1  ORF type:complete len:585 (+),score=106.79 TRINITY_DN10235_c0_g1_i1:104-1858(+)
MPQPRRVLLGLWLIACSIIILSSLHVIPDHLSGNDAGSGSYLASLGDARELAADSDGALFALPDAADVLARHAAPSVDASAHADAHAGYVPAVAAQHHAVVRPAAHIGSPPPPLNDPHTTQGTSVDRDNWSPASADPPPVSVAEYQNAVRAFAAAGTHPLHAARTDNASFAPSGGFRRHHLAALARIPWAPPPATAEWLRRNCGPGTSRWRWGAMGTTEQDPEPVTPEAAAVASNGGVPANLAPTELPAGPPRSVSPVVVVVSWFKGPRCWMFELTQRYHVAVLNMGGVGLYQSIDGAGVNHTQRWRGLMPPTYYEVMLQNRGKGEEKNYLRYFRDNYDDVPMWSAVMQGQPHSHLPRPVVPDLLTGAAQERERKKGIDTWITGFPPPQSVEFALQRLPVRDPLAPFQTLGGGRYRNFVCERMDGGLSRWRMANIGKVRHIYHALGLPEPPAAQNICHLAVCCQCFGVAASAVRAWPQETYQRLLDLRYTNRIHWNDIEFTWHLIFGAPPISDGLIETSWIPPDPQRDPPGRAWETIKERVALAEQTCVTHDANHTIECGPWRHADVHPVNRLGLRVPKDPTIL